MAKIKWVAVLMAILMTGLAARAGAQPKNRTFAGTVKSMDLEAKTMVVDEKGAELKVTLPAERVIFLRSAGTVDDMKEGRGVEATGVVSEDKTEVQTRVMVIYTERDRGGNTIYGNLTRADGKLAKVGDDWYVDTKDGKVKIVLAEKGLRISCLEPATVADIKEGATVYCYGLVGDGVATKVGLLSINK